MNDLAQMDMFARPIVSVPTTGLNLDERFERFLTLNGHVYSAFVLLAREYIEKTGRSRVGAKMLFEELRWRFAMRTRGESDFTLNNSYVSRLARLAAEREPDLADAFEFRSLRSVAA